jgi:predicted nucleic acid-binding protein
MRVLLDTNVILDAMLQRQPWHVEANAILQSAANGQVVCAASTLSLATVYHVGRRIVGTAAARSGIRNCLQAFEIVAIDKQALTKADALQGKDFEDDIQIAAAIAGSLDAIVTRNPSDFYHSPLAVWAPAELLQKLLSASAPPAPPATNP